MRSNKQSKGKEAEKMNDLKIFILKIFFLGSDYFASRKNNRISALRDSNL